MELVTDGAAARELLARSPTPPVLVLSDVHLPGGSGFELLSWIRTRWSRLPVLLWTSLPHPEGAREALDRGADGYMGKPRDLAGYHRIAARLKACLGD